MRGQDEGLVEQGIQELDTHDTALLLPGLIVVVELPEDGHGLGVHMHTLHKLEGLEVLHLALHTVGAVEVLGAAVLLLGVAGNQVLEAGLVQVLELEPPQETISLRLGPHLDGAIGIHEVSLDDLPRAVLDKDGLLVPLLTGRAGTDHEGTHIILLVLEGQGNERGVLTRAGRGDLEHGLELHIGQRHGGTLHRLEDHLHEEHTREDGRAAHLVVTHVLVGTVGRLHHKGTIEETLVTSHGPVKVDTVVHVVLEHGVHLMQALLDERVLGHVLLKGVAQLLVPRTAVDLQALLEPLTKGLQELEGARRILLQGADDGGRLAHGREDLRNGGAQGLVGANLNHHIRAGVLSKDRLDGLLEEHGATHVLHPVVRVQGGLKLAGDRGDVRETPGLGALVQEGQTLLHRTQDGLHAGGVEGNVPGDQGLASALRQELNDFLEASLGGSQHHGLGGVHTGNLHIGHATDDVLDLLLAHPNGQEATTPRHLLLLGGAVVDDLHGLLQSEQPRGVGRSDLTSRMPHHRVREDLEELEELKETHLHEEGDGLRIDCITHLIRSQGVDLLQDGPPGLGLEELVGRLDCLAVDRESHEGLPHARPLGALAREDVADLHLTPFTGRVHTAGGGEGSKLLRELLGGGSHEGLAVLEAGTVDPHGRTQVLEGHRGATLLDVVGHALGEELQMGHAHRGEREDQALGQDLLRVHHGSHGSGRAQEVATHGRHGLLVLLHHDVAVGTTDTEGVHTHRHGLVLGERLQLLLDVHVVLHPLKVLARASHTGSRQEHTVLHHLHDLDDREDTSRHLRMANVGLDGGNTQRVLLEVMGVTKDIPNRLELNHITDSRPRGMALHIMKLPKGHTRTFVDTAKHLAHPVGAGLLVDTAGAFNSVVGGPRRRRDGAQDLTENTVTVGLRVGETLEDDGAHPFTTDVALGAILIEGVRGGALDHHTTGLEGQVEVLLVQVVEPRHECRVAVALLEGGHGHGDRHQGGRAGRLQGDGRTVGTQEVGDLIGKGGHDLPTEQGLVGTIRSGQEGRVSSHEDTGACTIDLVQGDTSVLEALKGGLQHTELLQVHVAGDLALDVEQVGVVAGQLCVCVDGKGGGNEFIEGK